LKAVGSDAFLRSSGYVRLEEIHALASSFAEDIAAHSSLVDTELVPPVHLKVLASLASFRRGLNIGNRLYIPLSIRYCPYRPLYNEGNRY